MIYRKKEPGNLETILWFCTILLDIFLIGLIGYGETVETGHSGTLDSVIEALPLVAQITAPAALVTAIRMISNAINKMRANRTTHVHGRSKTTSTQYVVTHYKDAIDKIITFSKSNDIEELKHIAQDIEEMEQKINITPKQEEVIHKKVAKHVERVTKNFSNKEKAKITKLLSGLAR